MQTKTFTCDQCGVAEITPELPFKWRRAALQSHDGDNVDDADLCSPGCAAAWIEKQFKVDLGDHH